MNADELFLDIIRELRKQLTLLHSQNAELRADLHAVRNEKRLRATMAGEDGETPFLPTLDELESAAQANPKLGALFKSLAGGMDG